MMGGLNVEPPSHWLLRVAESGRRASERILGKSEVTWRTTAQAITSTAAAADKTMTGKFLPIWMPSLAQP
jgi:hypothetical protein